MYNNLNKKKLKINQILIQKSKFRMTKIVHKHIFLSFLILEGLKKCIVDISIIGF